MSCRLEYWNRNKYSSLNVAIDSDSDDTSSDSEGEGNKAWSREINYIRGNVTHPQNAGNNYLIIVHCVGKCMCCVQKFNWLCKNPPYLHCQYFKKYHFRKFS